MADYFEKFTPENTRRDVMTDVFGMGKALVERAVAKSTGEQSIGKVDYLNIAGAQLSVIGFGVRTASGQFRHTTLRADFDGEIHPLIGIVERTSGRYNYPAGVHGLRNRALGLDGSVNRGKISALFAAGTPQPLAGESVDFEATTIKAFEEDDRQRVAMVANGLFHVVTAAELILNGADAEDILSSVDTLLAVESHEYA